MLLSSYISCAIAPGHGIFFFFFQAEDGIRDIGVTGVQTCALPICTILQNHTLRSARSTERGWSWYDGPLWLVKVPCLAYLARLRAAAGQQQHARTQCKQRCRSPLVFGSCFCCFSGGKLVTKTFSVAVPGPVGFSGGAGHVRRHAKGLIPYKRAG